MHLCLRFRMHLRFPNCSRFSHCYSEFDSVTIAIFVLCVGVRIASVLPLYPMTNLSQCMKQIQVTFSQVLVRFKKLIFVSKKFSMNEQGE